MLKPFAGLRSDQLIALPLKQQHRGDEGLVVEAEYLFTDEVLECAHRVSARHLAPGVSAAVVPIDLAGGLVDGLAVATDALGQRSCGTVQHAVVPEGERAGEITGALVEQLLITLRSTAMLPEERVGDDIEERRFPCSVVAGDRPETVVPKVETVALPSVVVVGEEVGERELHGNHSRASAAISSSTASSRRGRSESSAGTCWAT